MTTVGPKCRLHRKTFFSPPLWSPSVPAGTGGTQSKWVRGKRNLNFILGGNSAKTLWFMHAVRERLANHKGASCSKGWSRWRREGAEPKQPLQAEWEKDWRGKKTAQLKLGVLLGQTVFLFFNWRYCQNEFVQYCLDNLVPSTCVANEQTVLTIQTNENINGFHWV